MDVGPRVVFMGTPEFAVPPLEALLRSGYQVAGVLTREDQPAGRGQRVEESPVKQIARAADLLVLQPRTLRDPAALAALETLNPDLIVVAAYGLILPPAALNLPPRGCINIHGSLLPKHRGAAPIAAAILAGDAETGVSIMLMDAGVDTGPVLTRAAIPIALDDTTGALTARLAALGAELLIDALPRWLAGKADLEPQPSEGVSYAPRIEKREGQIRWDEAASLIERRVRAYQPWPSAYTSWRGQLLRVVRARTGEDSGHRVPGTGELPELSAHSKAAGLVIEGARGEAGVVTGDGVLWLEEVQLAGKRALSIEEFLRGAPGFVGSQLE
jgi:methionyl-tRNA formyltransferase